MYLSCLLINVGDNPDRQDWRNRNWLRNLYRVHQRLCMAFPSMDRKANDACFLKPFKPEEFGNGQVHVKRAVDSGFLFRIDPLPNGRAMILVQSAIKPDWGYAFHNANYLLATCPEVKSYDPSFTKSQRLRFCLVANPTKKIDTIKKEERRKCTKEELKVKKGRHGKRVPVPSDRLGDWLISRANAGGFEIDKESLVVQTGYVYFNKEGKGQGKRLRSARFDGVLTVTDPERLRETLVRGIGPAKAFGFGLLSVARSA